MMIVGALGHGPRLLPSRWHSTSGVMGYRALDDRMHLGWSRICTSRSRRDRDLFVKRIDRAGRERDAAAALTHPRDGSVAKTAREVIVHDAHPLKQRVDDRRPDEAEAAATAGPSRWSPRAPSAPADRSANGAAPGPAGPRRTPTGGVERSVLLLHREEARGRSPPVESTLERLRTDRRVAQHLLALGGLHRRGLLRHEAMEKAAIAVALVEDGAPQEEACLRPLEGEHLEEAHVVEHRYAPLFVVGTARVRVRNPPRSIASPLGATLSRCSSSTAGCSAVSA